MRIHVPFLHYANNKGTVDLLCICADQRLGYLLISLDSNQFVCEEAEIKIKYIFHRKLRNIYFYFYFTWTTEKASE